MAGHSDTEMIVMKEDVYTQDPENQGSGARVGLVCESQIKELVGGVGSGLVGLYIKVVLTGKSFTISRNQRAWEGQCLQDQGPKCQHIKNTKKKKI